MLSFPSCRVFLVSTVSWEIKMPHPRKYPVGCSSKSVQFAICSVQHVMCSVQCAACSVPLAGEQKQCWAQTSHSLQLDPVQAEEESSPSDHIKFFFPHHSDAFVGSDRRFLLTTICERINKDILYFRLDTAMENSYTFTMCPHTHRLSYHQKSGGPPGPDF